MGSCVSCFDVAALSVKTVLGSLGEVRLGLIRQIDLDGSLPRYFKQQKLATSPLLQIAAVPSSSAAMARRSTSDVNGCAGLFNDCLFREIDNQSHGTRDVPKG